MISCEIIGSHSRISRRDLQEIFFWGISELMPSRRSLDVVISIYDLRDEGVTGYHCHSDRYNHEIELSKYQTRSDIITALFHELVHVRQTSNGIYSEDHIPYYERPTEIEAYQLQEELYIKWKQQSRYGSINKK